MGKTLLHKVTLVSRCPEAARAAVPGRGPRSAGGGVSGRFCSDAVCLSCAQVLTLKAMGINDMLGFDFMDPPPAATLVRVGPRGVG